jgi:hypothetical protein
MSLYPFQFAFPDRTQTLFGFRRLLPNRCSAAGQGRGVRSDISERIMPTSKQVAVNLWLKAILIGNASHTENGR